MAIAFRSVSSLAYANHGGSSSVSPPAGLANDDIIIANTFVGISGGFDAITAPAGFTAVHTAIQAGPSGGIYGTFQTFWKRAASESGNYVFTNTGSNTEIVLRAFSGCIASGSPIDAFSIANGLGTTTTATTITTTVANTLLVMAGNNWQGGGATPTSGWTERYDFVISSQDKNTLNAAGATGSVVMTPNGNSGGTDPWTVCLLALKPPAAGGGGGKSVKVWSGSAWVTKTLKVWSGSAWVTKPAKVWNGSAWV